MVIHIPLLHAQHAAEVFGREDGVAHPCDVADIVFFALVHLNIYVDMLLVHIPHAVFHDGGITIAQFVVFVEQVLLVGLVAVGGEFL